MNRNAFKMQDFDLSVCMYIYINIDRYRYRYLCNSNIAYQENAEVAVFPLGFLFSLNTKILMLCSMKP